MSVKNTYAFTLVLHGVDENTENLEDILYDAGCDDALINFRDGTVFLDFDRDALNLKTAVLTAIKDIENSPLDAKVVSVAPDRFVSEADIARRINKTRQTVSNWIKGHRRCKVPFPNPLMKLDDKSPLWRWYDVAQWLHQHEQVDDPNILTNALFFEAINAALLERDKSTKDACHQLAKELEKITGHAA